MILDSRILVKSSLVFIVYALIYDKKQRQADYAADDYQNQRCGLAEKHGKCRRPENEGVHDPHDTVCTVVCGNVRYLRLLDLRPSPKLHRLFPVPSVYPERRKQCAARYHDDIPDQIIHIIVSAGHVSVLIISQSRLCARKNMAQWAKLSIHF